MGWFNTTLAVAGFLGGWCGSVPISLIIWWIIHHGGPPPPPDPWWKISIAGAIAGLIAGPLVVSMLHEPVTTMSVVASTLIGITAGSIVGGIVGHASLPRR
jgi:CDP-diglyceride synthetase